MSFESQLSDSLPALRRFARKLAREDGEDLVQETIVLALSARRGFDGLNMKAWLFTIMKNKFFNLRRKESLRRKRETEVMTSACGVWRADKTLSPSAKWESRDAVRVLESLMPEHRDIVIAVGLEGLRHKEASERIGCPVGTVMSRLHRARAAFAGAMP